MACDKRAGNSVLFALCKFVDAIDLLAILGYLRADRAPRLLLEHIGCKSEWNQTERRDDAHQHQVR